MTAGRPLRVALLVEGPTVPAWVASLAERLAAASAIELEVLASGARRAAGEPRPYLDRVYERLDARLFPRRPDALAPARVEARALASGSLGGSDVVLDFASAAPVEAAPRLGIWTLAHGPTPFGLYEVRIEARRGGGAPALVYESYGALDPASPYRTRNRALWKATRAFTQRLETVRRLGEPFLDSRPTLDGGTPAANRGSGLAIAGGAVRSLSGVVGRLVRTMVGREAWFVATRPRQATLADGNSADGFVPLATPARSAAADPFVVDEAGETYLFYEDDDPRRGRGQLAHVRLDRTGRAVSKPGTALARPYHLSYPFVFRHGSDVFLLPESSANGTVELYRASRFPDEWILEAVLLEGVRAFDATLHVEEERLWLFVTLAEEGTAATDELHLYSSTSLAGHWEPHPLNPVVSDVRSARPAGRLFRRGGGLIRPAQDSSRRYGGALVLNRVDVLSPDDYAETPITRIEPDWYPGIFATHTYTFGEHVEALDGKRRVPRGPLRRLRR